MRTLAGSSSRAVPRRARPSRRRCAAFYPFFPLVGGRVMQPFTWREHRFAEGDWVLLDIYGTNRDPAAWDRPERFSPERFVDRRGDPYTLIPQGGGDHLRDHRCAGEWLTIALTRLAVDVLAREIEYDVPGQDLTVSLSRMPARPASGCVIERVRSRGGPGGGADARGVAGLGCAGRTA
ncbi:MAG TPA: cytochrome P450 [Solirubrobacteraceae bacterium]|nr:cytochrome P450 [Solirubrobacteraceae bacterium]